MSKVQVLECKCGAKYAGCCEPSCYTDKDWLKEVRECALNGGKVYLVDSQDFKFERCTCNDDSQKEIIFE